MSNIQNPTSMSDYDWMEFVGFAWKVESEGYEYAAENYSPKFEDAALQELAHDETKLRALYRGHVNKVETWAEAVGWKQSGALYDAHLLEEKQRRENHLLWAVHPGGDWDYAPYSDAFATREDVDKWLAGRERLVADHGWKPFTGRILHRDVPGGEWTEVPRA